MTQKARSRKLATISCMYWWIWQSSDEFLQIVPRGLESNPLAFSCGTAAYYCFLRRISLSHFPYDMTIIIILFSDWSDEAVSNAEILRLIYQGRFLHCNVTLSALGLATGKTTVMHLVPRENLPEPNSQGTYSIIRHHTPFVM